MNTLIENDPKLGTKVKPNWKLSRVRAIVVEATEKAVRIDLNYSSKSEYYWIPKSLIVAIEGKEDGVWHGDSYLTLPTWFCVEHRFTAEP